MRRFIIAFLLFCFFVCGLSGVQLKIEFKSSADTKILVEDVSKVISSLLPEKTYLEITLDGSNLLATGDSTQIDTVYELTFIATYDATQNKYNASWYDQTQLAYSCSYSPKDQRPYSDFVRECAHYPLEKVSLWLLKNDQFEKYLRITYHPSVDEYGSFSPDGKYFAFITDRLSGNRNIALLDLQAGKITVLPVAGSSEYFPRFSPDGKRLLFQGSLHGFWNIYVMPLENYSKNIVLISAGNNPAYNPCWYDDGTVLYVQDSEYGNRLLLSTIAKKRKQIEIPYPFEMVFSPTVYKDTIYFVGLKESDFGIYALTSDGTVTVVENTVFNEHDPAISPDGRYLAYSCNITGYYTIWVKDLFTQEKWCITQDIPHDAFYPVFSPDGKVVAFSVYEGNFEPDIWFVRFRPVSSTLQAESVPRSSRAPCH
ncbi:MULTISPECIES: TolB family protein [Pseudothermotoga]|jgi:TolB protein|uniref:WD40 domain protein beta Propeller n=1 Tax=Pseudothermotoga lettingae (strain ATCC BAA-301 / DSM 14385 / NBRC 107922 / TMO) TaxID=416591 RepID=A8F3K9_PSELT|nr:MULTISPECIES: PD40 domain-containing protein [Pseudothermotoga]ABV32743.1 conserved hypothetical protein [Pseudothermotoga lettingae TMO]KUK20632.1 MAG: Uncharacterized protein XD56_1448 [Pseudothermotoga lettingae]MDI3495601.1 TolB protein [Pseudothermotoga sp.]MDK2885249.1 TolB protein [Pseudothermotoga sp.]GLI48263.1 hypothetical protein PLETTINGATMO_04320 [Pseudothermotoga lettingae TMO]